MNLQTEFEIHNEEDSIIVKFSFSLSVTLHTNKILRDYIYQALNIPHYDRRLVLVPHDIDVPTHNLLLPDQIPLKNVEIHFPRASNIVISQDLDLTPILVQYPDEVWNTLDNQQTSSHNVHLDPYYNLPHPQIILHTSSIDPFMFYNFTTSQYTHFSPLYPI